MNENHFDPYPIETDIDASDDYLPHGPLCPVTEMSDMDYAFLAMMFGDPCAAARPLSELVGLDFLRALEVLHNGYAEADPDEEDMADRGALDYAAADWWHESPAARAAYPKPIVAVTGLTALFLFHHIGTYAPCLPAYSVESAGHSDHEILYGLPVLSPAAALADMHAMPQLRHDCLVDELGLARLIDEALTTGKATEQQIAHCIEISTNGSDDGETVLRYYGTLLQKVSSEPGAGKAITDGA